MGRVSEYTRILELKPEDVLYTTEYLEEEIYDSKTFTLETLEKYLVPPGNNRILINKNGSFEVASGLIWTSSTLHIDGSISTQSLTLNETYIDNIENELSGSPTSLITSEGVQQALSELGETFINNEEPSVITVGGIELGTTFENVSLNTFVEMLLYPELEGELTPPSLSFESNRTGLYEIGEELTINFSATFDRGSIDPQYESDSPYRSGNPSQYEYGHWNIISSKQLEGQAKEDLSDEQIIMDYSVIPGQQGWRARVHYEAGIQPKGSKGTPFDSPLDSGHTNWSGWRTITGVLPVFATSQDIGDLTPQTLVENGSRIEIFLVAETGGVKQKIDFPNDSILSWGTITGIEQFDTVSNQWVWLGGSKSGSLATFSTSSIIRPIQGIDRQYQRWEHIGSTIGSRTLRFYTT